MSHKTKSSKSKVVFSSPRVTRPGDPVAIIGIGTVMPDAFSVEQFWENIRSGKNSIREVPKERWDPELYYDPDRNAPDKSYSKIGSFVTNFEFNSLKFRIPPKVAQKLDLVQQMALEAARQALEEAETHSSLNRENTAVILGNSMGGEIVRQYTRRVYFPEVIKSLKESPNFNKLNSTEQEAILVELKERYLAPLAEITEDSMPGELANVIAGRIANVFNLRGKNMTTDAACASSMAAIDQAYKSLVSGEVDAVLCGGADRSNEISSYVKFCKIGALSPDGSRPFDKDANGFVMGEGVGFFLMKRLKDAVQDGDKIYAIIRGVGSSSDGKGKGITAPNPVGQELAIRRALANSGVDASEITLIEAHGTSTAVGDVVEVDTLQKVFQEYGVKPRTIALGSIKSQIGHLKSAAGAAAIIKVALALHHKTLPPSINFKTPNPKIDWESSPFYVNTVARPWEHDSSKTRKAGVSAFGFGGTNFHVIMEEYNPDFDYFPALEGGEVEALPYEEYIRRNERLFGESLHLSASSDSALQEKIQGVIQDIPKETILTNEDGSTLLEIRQKLEGDNTLEPYRLSLAFRDTGELKKSLEFALTASQKSELKKGAKARGIYFSDIMPEGKVVFLFPGQGSQYVDMLKDLRDRYPVVRKTFEEGDEILKDFLGFDLSSLIFSSDSADKKEMEDRLRQTQFTQPAMLVADIAMFRLLQQCDINPDMVAGHSLGEYAALVAAGVLSFKDALMAVAIRGKAMSEVDAEDKGTMASVSGSLDEVVRILEEEVDGYAIAANKNSTKRVVISGSTSGVEEAIKVFESKGMKTVKLNVSAAFHSRIVAPAAKKLADFLQQIEFKKPEIPVSSNVLGDFYPEDPEEIRKLLERQVESPVEWTAQTESMYISGGRFFIEVGPKRALASFVAEILSEREHVSIVSNHPKKGGIFHFHDTLAACYAFGIKVNREIEQDPAFEKKPVKKVEISRAVRTTPLRSKDYSIQPAQGSATVDITAMISEDLTAEPLFDKFLEFQGRAFSSFVRESYESFKRNFTSYSSGESLLEKFGINLDGIVVTGTGVGLPGKNKEVFDPENIRKILNGENMIDPVGREKELQQTDKNIVRLVKSGSSGSFQTIDSTDDVIKLAGQPGHFDLVKEYQVAEKMIAAYDTTTSLAIAAGLEALKDAGIPLVREYTKTTTGSFLPGDWVLPEDLRERTGVIFASAFPGYDSLVEDLTNYYKDKFAGEAVDVIRKVYGEIARKQRQGRADPELLDFLDKELEELQKHRSVFKFNRKFLFRVLSMGHSQFAQLIKAYGPNTQTNAACASTTQAVGIAEDWIRNGRCDRVIIISADNVSSDNLFEWIGSGFLISGAATTKRNIAEAALPFDRRRHGLIIGMGAVGLVIETKSESERRGVKPIVEILGTHYANSAYHGTRLDVDHITYEMKKFMEKVRKQHGVSVSDVARSGMFMSHETYTPARGGSAAAEINSIRETFGPDADKLIVANTKGFTGHPMGAGIEDAIAIKALEYGIIPPIANFKEPDESLGNLRLSKGEKVQVQYAFRIAAGFGSQLAFALYRKASEGERRTIGYSSWLRSIGGSVEELITVGKTLRLKDKGAPPKEQPTTKIQPITQKTQTVAKKQQSTKTVTVSGDIVSRIANYVGYPVEMITDDIIPSKDLGMKLSEISQLVGQEVTDENISVGQLKKSFGELSGTTTISVSSKQKESVKSPTARKVSVSADRSKILDEITAQIAEHTGYPKEMLDVDLDMEADLGIDTVKQAEIFGEIRERYGIPFDENLDLGEYNTINKIADFVLGSSTESVSHSETSVEAITDEPVQRVSGATDEEILNMILQTVAEETGYPTEMLDPDLDLEADLGIDTVKQAEIFGAVREHYNIPFDENLDLGEYNTIRKVAGFVIDNTSGETKSPKVETKPSSRQDRQILSTQSRDKILDEILEVVAQETGYPKEMLEPDLDMEADLGIDTVKQAEIFGQIRESHGIPFDENLDLGEYNTINKVVDFVIQNSGDKGEEPSVEAPSKQVDVSKVPRDKILEKIVNTIVEQTGYPAEMLEPDLDMEADLGIDTVKQAEMIGIIRDEYGIPFDENLDLGDVSTINKMVDFVISHLDSVKQEIHVEEKKVVESPEDTVSLPEEQRKKILDALIKEVSSFTGYPSSLIVEETDVASDLGLDEESVKKITSKVAGDFGLTAPDVYSGTIRTIADSMKSEAPLEQTHKYKIAVASSSIQGEQKLEDLIILGESETLLIDEGTIISKIDEFSGGTLVIANPDEGHGSIKEYFMTFKKSLDDTKKVILYIDSKQPSIHGLTPIQGAIGGLIKSLNAEFAHFSGKIVVNTASSKEQIYQELSSDDDVEVILNNGRHVVGLQELEPEFKEFTLEEGSVLLVTGGAQGITFECVKGIVGQGVKVALLGRTRVREDAEKISKLSEAELKDAKQTLFEKMKEGGEKVTPVMLEKEWSKIIKSSNVYRAIAELQGLGAEVSYHSVDVTDGEKMKEVITDIQKHYGDITHVIHGAGVEISRPTPSKSEEEFALVYDIKVKGLENIISNVDVSKIKRFMCFSSVAGRFGNATQADYSAANEYLAKSMALLREKGVNASVIDWSAWKDVGMATKGSTMKVLEQAGVTPIPVDEGVKHFVTEFGFGEEVEVVISGELGIFADKIRIFKEPQQEQSKQGETKDSNESASETSNDENVEKATMDSESSSQIKEAKEEEEGEDLGSEREKDEGKKDEQTSKLFPDTPPNATAVKEKGELDNFPMIDLLYKLDNEIRAVRMISLERDLYLDDHRIEEKAVLPGVMGLEFMAELGKALGGNVVEFRDVSFKSPIKLPRDRPLEICSILTTNSADADDSIHVSVKSKFIGPDGKQLGDLREHFEATLCERRHFPAYPGLSKNELQWFKPERALMSKKTIYKIFFHGPRFQVLNKVLALGEVSIGCEYRHPDEKQFEGKKYEDTLISPLVIEACFQTAGMYDLLTNHRMSLPSSIGVLKLYKDTGKVKYIHATKLREKDNHTYYQVQAFDERGNVALEIFDFGMIHTGVVSDIKNIKPTYDLDIATVRHLLGDSESKPTVLSIDAFDSMTPEFIEDAFTTSEKFRLDKLKVKKRRLDWVAGVISAKLAISLVHKVPEVEINIIQDELGKPMGMYGDIKLPVTKTHSNGIAISVSSKENCMGVDLERIEKRKKSFITTAFTQKEQDMYELGPEKAEVVSRLWTIKEAALKADGTGLRDNLHKTRISGKLDGEIMVKTPKGEKEVYSKTSDKWVVTLVKCKN